MKIKIDTTHISDVLTGSSILEKHINDTWFYKDVELISGKIYALVSEYGQGCMYLSYLLGGNVKLGYVQVYVDGNSISEKDLKSLSWNLEPLCSKVKNQQVKKSIQQAIVKTGCKLTFEEISEQFF